MDAGLKGKVVGVIEKIQKDPDLLKEFEANPAKTVEKVADFNIPDILEPLFNTIAKQQMSANPEGNQDKIMKAIEDFFK